MTDRTISVDDIPPLALLIEAGSVWRDARQEHGTVTATAGVIAGVVFALAGIDLSEMEEL